MCGIVAFVGRGHRAMDVLIDGLRRLEYRGYDSAGVAILDGGEIQVRRALGKLANLEGVLRDKPIGGRIGIGHTRWATHGKPSERNAHPHRAGGAVVVHNGIIENYRKLRQEFEAAGRTMTSDTDTELIAHLIDVEVAAGKDLLGASRAACRRLEGSYAFAVLSTNAPDYIVAAKNGGSPIILGLGEKQTFLASDIPAILPYTRQMVFLEDGDFAVLSEDGAQVVDIEGRPVEREPKPIQWDPVSAEKGGYDRFMQKEIFEQPRAIMDTIGTRIVESGSTSTSMAIDSVAHRPIASGACTSWPAERPITPACRQVSGSSSSRGVPVQVDLASEYRYRGARSWTNAVTWCWSSPVRRDGRHARRARQGSAGGARVVLHLQRARVEPSPRARRRSLHPRRSRDRGRLDEGLHDPARPLYLLALPRRRAGVLDGGGRRGEIRPPAEPAGCPRGGRWCSRTVRARPWPSAS